MIDDGLFTLFPMDAVFGMHNWPGMEAGTFGVVAGPIMASSNTFEVRLEGKGANGAMPHLGVDPVMAAVQLAPSLQTIDQKKRVEGRSVSGRVVSGGLRIIKKKN